MTPEHWLTIAIVVSNTILAITTLLAPTLAVIVQVRLNQPKLTPITNEEKTLSFKIGFWVGKHAGRVLAIGLIWCLSMLAVVIFRLPLTRWSVVVTSLDTTLIAVQVFAYMLLKLSSFAYEEFSKHLTTIYNSLAQNREHISLIDRALWPPDEVQAPPELNAGN